MTSKLSGLLIRAPHIDRILRGEKTWEMRSTQTTRRGTIALIESGTGTVVGLADLIDCCGPLPLQERKDASGKHGLSAIDWENPDYAKYSFAWVLDNVRALEVPVPYTHRSGAVIWANLDEAVSERVFLAACARRRQVDEYSSKNIDVSLSYSQSSAKSSTSGRHPNLTDTCVPFARDGTCFHFGLAVGGVFTVGEKMAEQKFSSYAEALAHLRKMKVAKWRRPNSITGKRGIVSAVEWRDGGSASDATSLRTQRPADNKK